MKLYHFLNEELKEVILPTHYLKILFVIFFLNTEKASKLARIKIAYKKETIKFPPIKIKYIDNGKTINEVRILLFILLIFFQSFFLLFCNALKLYLNL